MWSTLWYNRNLAEGSEANGGPLSVIKHLRIPYCEKSCVNLHITVSAVFVDILKVKGYLLNISAIRRYSLFLNLKKLAERSCQGASGTSLGITGWVCWVALCCICVLQHLRYSDISASIPGQYSVALALFCIFSIPRCMSCNSVSDLSKSSGGKHMWSPFNSMPSSIERSSLAPWNCLGILGTSLICLANH